MMPLTGGFARSWMSMVRAFRLHVRRTWTAAPGSRMLHRVGERFLKDPVSGQADALESTRPGEPSSCACDDLSIAESPLTLHSVVIGLMLD